MNIIKKNDKPIQALLKEFVNKNEKIKIGFAVLDIESIYREKMGKIVSNYTQTIFLKGNTLYIKIISAPLKAELQYSKESLKALLNGHLGHNLIKEIRFI